MNPTDLKSRLMAAADAQIYAPDTKHEIGEAVAWAEGMSKEHERLRPLIESLIDTIVEQQAALEFYQNKDGTNYQFIFDDETGSRGQVYEKYKKHSIGDMGVKAHEWRHGSEGTRSPHRNERATESLGGGMMALRGPGDATPEAIQKLAEGNLIKAMRIKELEAYIVGLMEAMKPLLDEWRKLRPESPKGEVEE